MSNSNIANITAGGRARLIPDGRYLVFDLVDGPVYLERDGQRWPVRTYDLVILTEGEFPTLYLSCAEAARVEWRSSPEELRPGAGGATVNISGMPDVGIRAGEEIALTAQTLTDLGVLISGGLTVQVDGQNVTLDAATVAAIRAAGQHVDVDSLPNVVLDAATVAAIRAAGQHVDVDSLPNVVLDAATIATLRSITNLPNVILDPATIAALNVNKLEEGGSVTVDNIPANLLKEGGSLDPDPGRANRYRIYRGWAGVANKVSYIQMWVPGAAPSGVLLQSIQAMTGSSELYIGVTDVAEQVAHGTPVACGGGGGSVALVGSGARTEVDPWTGNVEIAGVAEPGQLIDAAWEIQPGSGLILYTSDPATMLRATLIWEDL